MASCSADVMLRSLSLFGSVEAQQVVLRGETPSVVGLQIGSTSATGSHFALGWGRLVVGERTDTYVAALSLTLSRQHEGLPPGTRILVGVGPAAPPAPVFSPTIAPKKKVKKHKRHKATHQPLKVTPRLQVHKFVFPLVGNWGVGDSYGGPRSDVPGNWHHGDDLFAPIGTPVVAVANGTVNRVGWEKLGGWRLWVRDAAGDQFYYAHMSGYAPGVLKSKKVTRGQVIGFVGNTGDAFTTPPHLHFEVHPRKLLHLGYDGAVDPTRYLEKWPHVLTVAAPHPVHPRLPRSPLLHAEATKVWNELLAARHLIVRRPPKLALAAARRPFDAGSVAAVASGPLVSASAPAAPTSPWAVIWAGAGLVVLIGAFGGFAYRRRS
jgi:murein DD-endopeptidase MepM/ murein hydrolase activator NlpD